MLALIHSFFSLIEVLLASAEVLFLLRHLAERIFNYVPCWDSSGETFGNLKVY